MVADDDTGELEGVTILGPWGEVPEDFVESLQGADDRPGHVAALHVHVSAIAWLDVLIATKRQPAPENEAEWQRESTTALGARHGLSAGYPAAIRTDFAGTNLVAVVLSSQRLLI